jgi:FkbM family methyltransferase
MSTRQGTHEPPLATERQLRLEQATGRARTGRVGRLLRNPLNEGLAIAMIVGGRYLPWSLRVTAHTFFGRPMTVLLPEPVSLCLYRAGVFESDLTQAILWCLGRGDVFFDVGAHFGYYSLLAAEIVGPVGRVFSFEPTPRTHRILSENVSAHPNVEACQYAVHRARGTLELSDFGPTYSAFNSLLSPRLGEAVRRRLAPRRITVEAWSIDAFVADRGVGPDFVKIDAESAEMAILGGMEETLSTYRPLVALEVGDMDIPGAPASRDLVMFMIAHGYEPWEIDGLSLRPHGIRETYPFANLLFAPRGTAPRSSQDVG